MSKVLRATCEAGVVTAEAVAIAAARIQSAGLGPSEGVLVLDEARAEYITSNASDLDECIDAMLSALSNAGAGLTATSSALSTLGAATGTSIAIAGNISSISAAISILSAAANTLSEIKARLK